MQGKFHPGFRRVIAVNEFLRNLIIRSPFETRRSVRALARRLTPASCYSAGAKSMASAVKANFEIDFLARSLVCEREPE